MKKSLFIAAMAACVLAGCQNNKTAKCDCQCTDPACTCQKDKAPQVAAEETYTVVEKPQTDLAALPKDADGFVTLFDGKTLNGWRGYGMDNVPTGWDVQDGAIHLNGSGTGEAQNEGRGDLIFAHKFQNFELQLEYKVSEGGNSGIFYLAQEVTTPDKDGKPGFLPIWQSASEYQVLDNERHPDAKLGVDGNRQAASLYDMIPAKPQNAKKAGEWNTAKIMVYKGTVIHGQNGANVVEYHLWTPKWTEMLQNSKFKEGGDFKYAFALLNNIGGEKHEGYIGLQDHGDDVWYRNIKIKVLE